MMVALLAYPCGYEKTILICGNEIDLSMVVGKSELVPEYDKIDSDMLNRIDQQPWQFLLNIQLLWSYSWFIHGISPSLKAHSAFLLVFILGNGISIFPIEKNAVFNAMGCLVNSNGNEGSDLFDRPFIAWNLDVQFRFCFFKQPIIRQPIGKRELRRTSILRKPLFTWDMKE